jgi:hypothetical protein
MPGTRSPASYARFPGTVFSLMDSRFQGKVKSAARGNYFFFWGFLRLIYGSKTSPAPRARG